MDDGWRFAGMISMNGISAFLKNVRAASWWNRKATWITALAFLCISQDHSALQEKGLLVPALWWSIACTAIFGYILNDWFDRSEDKSSGRNNLFDNGSNWQWSLPLWMMAACLPWMLLNAGWISLFPLLGIFLLFILYSVPPFRLKEKGWAGTCADAGYAFVLPSLFVFFIFRKDALQELIPIGFILLWSLSAGLRNILVHQYADMRKDEANQVRTAAVVSGGTFVSHIAAGLLLPEAVGICLMLIPHWGLVIGFLLYQTYQYFLKTRKWGSAFVETASGLTFFHSSINHFYERMFPLFTVLLCTGLSGHAWIFAGMLLIVFPSTSLENFREARDVWRYMTGGGK